MSHTAKEEKLKNKNSNRMAAIEMTKVCIQKMRLVLLY